MSALVQTLSVNGHATVLVLLNLTYFCDGVGDIVSLLVECSATTLVLYSRIAGICWRLTSELFQPRADMLSLELA